MIGNDARLSARIVAPGPVKRWRALLIARGSSTGIIHGKFNRIVVI
jgi:hypothetical protein